MAIWTSLATLMPRPTWPAMSPPVTTADRHEAELGVDESALDGNLDFLGNLDAETDVASHVADGDNSLEAGTLTGLGLLLAGDDLHDIVLELVLGAFDELVNDLGLLDGDGVSVDLLEGLDEITLNESAELGLGEPLVLGGTATGATGAATGATTATSAEATAAISAIATTTFTTAFTAALACSCYNWCCFH